MTAKEYLQQAYSIDRDINRKIEQISHLRAMTQNITASFSDDRVSKTRNVTSHEDAIIRLMDAEEEANRQIDAYVALRVEITGVIDQVHDADERLLLDRRYLGYRSWGDIASELQCSIRWVHTLHQRGLDSVDEILKRRAK